MRLARHGANVQPARLDHRIADSTHACFCLDIARFEFGGQRYLRVPHIMDLTMRPEPTTQAPMSRGKRLARGGILIVFAVVLALAAFLQQRDARGDSIPQVPRFASVKSSPANVRRGPSREHEILWVYRQASVPVEIIAEHRDWRRIRDWDGDEGWIYHPLLSSRRSVIIRSETATLRAAPEATAAPVALAEPGVIAKLLQCQIGWCEIDADGHEGWVAHSAIWGVYPDEIITN